MIIESSGSDYTIKDPINDGNYLYASGTGTNNRLGIRPNIATWDIKFSNGEVVIEGVSPKPERRWIKFNNTSNSKIFSCYKEADQSKVYLYKEKKALSADPIITLSDNDPQITAGNVEQGTDDHILSTFKIEATDAKATLNEATFLAIGDYSATDITDFKFWYNSTNTFIGANQLGSLASTSTGGGDYLELSGLNQTINQDATGYFWITADVSLDAEIGKQINIDAISAANLAFNKGDVSGTASEAGIQTITKNTVPTIVIDNITNTDFGAVCINETAATTGSFDFYGMNLTSDAVIGPLDGYSFSIDEITFTPSLTLPIDVDGDVVEVIYIRFSPTLVQSYDGDISISGGGAISVNVGVTGSGVSTATITNQPTDQTVNEGATATFTVVASDALSYQWEENTGSGWVEILGATSNTYTTPTTTLDMDGNQYRVKVTNTCGEITSDEAVLNVNEGPCGLETFENIPTDKDTSYQTREWTGDNGINWKATDARTDRTIIGKAIGLRNGSLTNTSTISKGIGQISFKYEKLFTGDDAILQVLVNGVQYGDNIIVSSTTPITFSETINVAGNINIEIKNIATSTYARVAIDDLEWTCYEFDFTWNGSVDTSWDEPFNWTPNGTPTADDSAWVPAGMPHYPAITGTALADKITVEEDASVKILDGGSLTVTNEMVNLGVAANFIVESDANLVQINDEAVNTGEITVLGEFKFTEGRQQYNFTMSPVDGQDIRQIFGDGNTIPFALVYNEKTDYFVVPQTAEYANKNGFAIKEVEGSGTATMTANYVGGISNGEFSFPLKKEGQGFNVLGNPYPSNLDLDKLYTDNSDKIESTFFFWDNINNTNYEQEGSGYNGSNYASFNAASGTNGSGKAAPCKDCGAVKIPTKNIKVGTGFMIQAKEEGALNYKNEYRTTENDGPNFFGKSNTETVEDDRYWLTLKKPNGISVMNVVVYFEGGKNEYAADDSQAFGSSDELYSWIEGYQLGIQGKSPFVVNDTIALGYRAFEAGEYQIDIFKQEGVFGNGTTIYLVDQDLDMVHNLSEGTYHFKTEAGEFNERFLIIYEEDEVLNTIDFANADIQVYRQDKTTVIRSLAKDLSELKIYNLNGQLLLHEDQLSGKQYHLPEGQLGKQVLLLNVKTADGKVHSFKILTY